MANHVHVLLEPKIDVARITKGIKGVTAKKGNQILGRTGRRLWQNESYDHWVRSPSECDRIRSYIERNPVMAGLVSRPEEWPWSSAARRPRQEHRHPWLCTEGRFKIKRTSKSACATGGGGWGGRRRRGLR